MKVHCQIEYTNKDRGNIHSDLCPENCEFKNITAEDILILHGALDEWLKKSSGTGAFRIYQDGVLPDLLRK